MNKRLFNKNFSELLETISRPSRIGRKTSVSQVNSNDTVTHYSTFECLFCAEENRKSAQGIKHADDCLHTKIKNIKMEDISAQVDLVLEIANSSYDYDGGGWSSCHFCWKDAWCRDGSGSARFVDKIKHKRDCPQTIAWQIVSKFHLNPPSAPTSLTADERQRWLDRLWENADPF